MSSKRAVSMYIGNPASEFFAGDWTHLWVDYVKVSHCTTWCQPISYLPCLGKAP